MRQCTILFIVALLFMLAWTTITHRRHQAYHADPLRHIEPFQLNVNTANAHMLDLLPGIGPVIAQRIVAFRQSQGPLTHLDQLQQVRGIGSMTRQKVDPWASCGPTPPRQP